MGMFDGLSSAVNQVGSWFKTEQPDYNISAPADMHDASSVSDYSKSVDEQQKSQQQYQQQTSDWLNSRQGYYDQLYGGMQQAGQGQIQYGEEDAMRNQRYAAAMRGNQGGSADLAGQAGIQNQAAAQYGQLNQQAQGAVDSQKLQDQQTAAGLYQQYANNPGLQAQYQAEMAASQARSGYSPDMANAASMGFQNQQQAGSLVSGAVGQSLSGLGGAVNTAAQLGYFNPQQAGAYNPGVNTLLASQQGQSWFALPTTPKYGPPGSRAA